MGASEHHDHPSPYKSFALRRLAWSLGITTVVMLVEVVGGWLSGSIALISDAGHMLTHAFAIGVSIFAILIARRPACHHRTFGLLRAEVLAAWINGLFLILVALWIVVEAVGRFLHPRDILTGQMLLVAMLGLIVNVVSLVLLEGSRHGDLSIRSVFMHMLGDAASSIAVVGAALVIRRTQWVWIDPVVSIAIAMWIAVWAMGLLRESTRVLLEMAPKGHNVEEISASLRERFPMIVETSNEHVWTITQEVIVFSAHLHVDLNRLSVAQMNLWVHEVERWLAEKFNITESTLQVQWVAEASPAGTERG